MEKSKKEFDIAAYMECGITDHCYGAYRDEFSPCLIDETVIRAAVSELLYNSGMDSSGAWE